jgi:hypothetical protein
MGSQKHTMHADKRAFLLIACLFIQPTINLSAQEKAPACTPVVSNRVEIVASEQIKTAGTKAEPPVNDPYYGFAWPDTPFGVIRSGSDYVFFSSDGGEHLRQNWRGRVYGNNNYGSVTRTVGTLDNPLGSAAPIDMVIAPNPDKHVNPYNCDPTMGTNCYGYIGGGPVYEVPAGQVGAGNLLVVYHSELENPPNYYSLLGLAASRDHGRSWTDLGEIIRPNYPNSKNLPRGFRYRRQPA